jgi:hypothetical protein
MGKRSSLLTGGVLPGNGQVAILQYTANVLVQEGPEPSLRFAKTTSNPIRAAVKALDANPYIQTPNLSRQSVNLSNRHISPVLRLGWPYCAVYEDKSSSKCQ